jgi:hypothetical protein
MSDFYVISQSSCSKPLCVDYKTSNSQYPCIPTQGEMTKRTLASHQAKKPETPKTGNLKGKGLGC